MNVLILGGEGLVGSAFTYGTKVGRKDADLTNYEQTNDLIKWHNPDWVINCAGKVGGVKANMDFKFDFFEKNTLINLNVIKACMENNVPNLISFMSTCIFPDEWSQKGRLNEDMLHLGEPHYSNYPYAYSKRMVDVMSRIAREQGFNYQCLIPTNLYGANDNYDLNNSHIVPALIKKIADAIIQNPKDFRGMGIEVWGTGTPIREFIFAGDIPNIISYIIENDVRFENMIISSQTCYSIGDVFHYINEAYTKLFGTYLGFTPNYNTSMPDGQFSKLTDTTKFRNLVPIQLTSMNDGLAVTIAHYIHSLIEKNKFDLKLIQE